MRVVNRELVGGQEWGVVVNDSARTDGEQLARRSVERMFSDHAQAVFAFASRRLGETAGRDVVGETFRIALENAASFDPARGTPRGWLFGIAANLVRRHWRSEERRVRTAVRAACEQVPVLDPLLRVDDRVDAAREVDQLLALIADLSTTDREALLMFAWDDLSYAEIAEVLSVPVGTVKSRIHRARQLLRAQTNGDQT